MFLGVDIGDLPLLSLFMYSCGFPLGVFFELFLLPLESFRFLDSASFLPLGVHSVPFGVSILLFLGVYQFLPRGVLE